MRVAMIVAQLGHYHRARLKFAAAYFDDLLTVVVHNAAEFEDFLASDGDGIALRKLYGGKSSYEAALKSGRLWRDVWDLLSDLKPDVVVVSGWAPPESVAAIAWARKKSVRAVVVSDSQECDAPRTPLREWIKRRVLSNVHAAFVAGSRHRDYLVKLGMRRQDIALGYDVVDNRHFSSASELSPDNCEHLRLEYGLPGRYLLAVGRFVEKKNVVGLVAAFSRVPRLLRDGWALVLVGDGPTAKAVDEAIEAYDVRSEVRRLGLKSYRELPTIYGLAEAFVHVACSEQWGLVVNEAAAAGLPLCVTSSCGAAPELVVQGLNGLAIDSCSVDSIRVALESIMSKTGEERRVMGQHSKRIVSAWNLDRFTSGLQLAVELALQSSNTRGRVSDMALMRLLALVRPSGVE